MEYLFTNTAKIRLTLLPLALILSNISCSDSPSEDGSFVFESLGFVIDNKTYSVDKIQDSMTVSLEAKKSLIGVIPKFGVPDGYQTEPENHKPTQNRNRKAENGDEHSYTITISQAKPDVKKLTKHSLKKADADGTPITATGFTLNSTNTHLVDVSYALPYGTDLSTDKFKIVATLTDPLSKFKQGNTEIENDVTEISLVEGDNVFTVVAQNNSTQTTTLKISIEEGSDAKELLNFKATNADDVPYQVNFSGQTVSIQVPSGTDVSAVKITTTISDKATKSIQDGEVAFTIGTAKNFVVTSQIGNENTYQVTVTENDDLKVTATRTSGRLVSYKDVTVTTLDSDDSSTSTESNQYTITYHSNNFIKSITKGVLVWTYYYDLFNRVYKKTYETANGTTATHYFYDANGKIVKADEYDKDNALKYIYVYNYENDKLETRVKTTISSSRESTSNYAFNSEGNLTQYGTSTLSGYDDKKNPYLELFPQAYMDIVDDPYYRSPNNPATYKTKFSGTTTHTDFQYNTANFLISKKVSKDKKECRGIVCTKVGTETTTTTYTYEESTN